MYLLGILAATELKIFTNSYISQDMYGLEREEWYRRHITNWGQIFLIFTQDICGLERD